MQLTTFLLTSAFTLLTAAQSAANPFTNSDYSSISAGQPFAITWSPTTTGPISLVLVKGDAAALTTVSTIASGLDNSGSFSWTPSSSLPAGSDYALKIVDDTDSTAVNYTPQFPIDSTGTASSAVASAEASSTANVASAESTAAAITTTADASTESPVADITTSTADAAPTDVSTPDASTTFATVTAEPDSSSSAVSAPGNSATTEPSATTSQASKSSSVSNSSSTGVAAATGVSNACVGLVGFVGASMLFL